MRQITLRLAEITLLRRALAIYERTYQDLAAKSTPQLEKDDLIGMVKAAEKLAHRLLHETKPVNPEPKFPQFDLPWDRTE